MQWFAGTILTALCGAALMGGAVFTSLDGETNFASLPERVEVALRGALAAGADRLGLPRKSDRLPTAEEPTFARQVIRVSTIARVGTHEVVRVRPFLRVAGNLSLTVSDLSANIPSLQSANAARRNSSTAPMRRNAAGGRAGRRSLLRDARSRADAAEAQDRGRNADRRSGRARARSRRLEQQERDRGAVAPDITGIKLAYAGEPAADPYAGFEARIVPENITLLPKTAAQTTGGNANGEKTIAVKKGESVASILRDLGSQPDDIKAITNLLGARGRDGGVKEGQKLRVLMAADVGAQAPQPIRVIIASDTSVEAVVALADTGQIRAGRR